LLVASAVSSRRRGVKEGKGTKGADDEMGRTKKVSGWWFTRSEKEEAKEEAQAEKQAGFGEQNRERRGAAATAKRTKKKKKKTSPPIQS
jgi:hypothetical protein